jgi:hypothetical protein
MNVVSSLAFTPAAWLYLPFSILIKGFCALLDIFRYSKAGIDSFSHDSEVRYSAF